MAALAEKRQAIALNEVLIPADTAEQLRLQRPAKAGEIARIATWVYVRATDPERQALIVRRNGQRILDYLFRVALVSHRST